MEIGHFSFVEDSVGSGIVIQHTIQGFHLFYFSIGYQIDFSAYCNDEHLDDDSVFNPPPLLHQYLVRRCIFLADLFTCSSCVTKLWP